MADRRAPPTLKPPPWQTTDDGTPRRVGVELEFGGLDLETAAEAVRAVFGGDIRRDDAHRLSVTGTPAGTFQVELDSDYVHPSDRNPTEGDLLDRAGAMARAALGDVIELWMPREIVTPPLGFETLPDLVSLCDRLRELGAVGTDASWRYAFSVQLNPEAPSLACERVLAIFRAYLLMSDWLRTVAAHDLLRRTLPFAQPFGRAYMAKVLAPDYRPDWPRFIDDYLTANRTRNRDLDLCPLFAHVDAERVKSHLDDPRIKARPAFHYRLPDSRIEDPEWSVITEWNRWVAVECLASDADMLAERSETFLDRFMARSESDWVEETAAWLDRHLDVRASA